MALAALLGQFDFSRSALPIAVVRSVPPSMVSATSGVLLVDHLNMNHEAGRHDLVKGFYFELLGLAIDPRKADNLDKGRKGLWANAGIHQFHLSEGTTAQVFDGVITLAYASLGAVRARLASPPAALAGSKFAWTEAGGGSLAVMDPWGSSFRLIEDASASDLRGVQPGASSEPLGLTDLLIHVPRHARRLDPLEGIVRFYCRVLHCEAELIGPMATVYIGGGQTLSFAYRPDGETVAHEELGVDEEGASLNNGAHVSMYVTDLPAAYRAAASLGVTYVNHRFSRRAYSLDEAVEQCMFRILDVVDPDAPDDGPILRLEHEVRACITGDGHGYKKYKSCPFRGARNLPDACS